MKLILSSEVNIAELAKIHTDFFYESRRIILEFKTA